MRRSFLAMAFTAIAAVAPAWVLADDMTILKQVEARIKAQQAAGQLRGSDFEIKVDQGSVTLSGDVSTPEQKTLALNEAAHVGDVTEVVDDLNVKSSRRSATSARNVAADQSVLANREIQPVVNQEPPPGPQQVAMRPGVAPAPYALQPVPTTMQPRAFAPAYTAAPGPGGPPPGYNPGQPQGYPAPYRYDQPQMPGYAWPSYAAHPNYAGVTYPKQYSPTAWPYIGPFYPYPQVPLGWRKVTLEWDDGWWMLDFKDRR
jgi:BON domain